MMDQAHLPQILIRLPFIARLQHADLVEQCPFLEVHQKTSAQAEFF